MNEENAQKIYLFILEHMNGWEDEQFDELSKEEIECDNIYQKLLCLNLTKEKVNQIE